MTLLQEFVWFCKSLSATLWFAFWLVLIIDFLVQGRRLSRWSFFLSTLGVFLSIGPPLMQLIHFLLWFIFLSLTYSKKDLQFDDPKIVDQKARSLLLGIILTHSIFMLILVAFLGPDAFLLRDYLSQIFQEDRWSMVVRLILFLGLAFFSYQKSRKALSLATLATSLLAIIIVVFNMWKVLNLGEQNIFVRFPVDLHFNILEFLPMLVKNIVLVLLTLFILFHPKTATLRQNLLFCNPSKMLRATAGFTGVVFISLCIWFIVCGIQAWKIFQNHPPLPPGPTYQVKAEMIHLLMTQEDPWFFYHHGVGWNNFEAIVNVDFQMRKLVYGASTITMQLAKLNYLDSKKTFNRKFRQMWMAWFLECNYRKEDLLKAYLESINFGLDQKGLSYASVSLYQKNPADLSSEEGAFLVRGVSNIKNLSPGVLGSENHLRIIALLRENSKKTEKYILPEIMRLSFVQK